MTVVYKTPFQVWLAVIFLPFLIFFWMVPFLSRVTIGNDYLQMLRMQMEMLFAVRTGTFPLYIPGFASGHSSAALTLGQIFHPISAIASIIPGYWKGGLIDVNNLLKLLTLGFAHLALLGLLRQLRVPLVLSFVISFITVYNLRIPDLYRYGPALEAYTGYIFLCSAIGWYYVRPTKRLGPLGIIVATYALVCSGHPQMMFYGFFGAGVFAMIIPFYVAIMLDSGNGNIRLFSFWIRTFLFMIMGILLSSAYILPFYFDFMSMNVERVSQGFSWAQENVDSIAGTMHNFLLPLRSEVHSAFGGSSILLMAILLPILTLFRVRIPRVIWMIWGLLLFFLLYMLGDRTPLFRLVWEYVPFVSSFRIPGRVSMIMPLFIMMLLAWAVKTDVPSLRVTPVAIMSVTAVIILLLYYFYYLAGYHVFSFLTVQALFPDYIAGSLYDLPYFWIEFSVMILGIASLILLAKCSIKNKSSRVLNAFLIAVLVVQVSVFLKYRSALWVDVKYESSTFVQMLEQKKQSLDYLYYPGGGMHSIVVTRQLEESFMEPFLGKLFTEVVPVDSLDQGYKKMALNRQPQQVFVEGYDPVKAKEFNEHAKATKDGSIRLSYSSYNRLQFQAISKSSTFLGLSYPFSGHWNARVNGFETRVYRVNGAAHAIEIPAGKSTIEFEYWSWPAFWGLVISSISFAFTAIFVLIYKLKGLFRIVGTLLVLLTSIAIVLLWNHSLYSGKDLETDYIWEYVPPPASPNLAYGNKSWLIYSATPDHWSFPHAQWHYRQQDLYVSRIVDGNKKRGSGFESRLSDGPAWVLGIGRPVDIAEIYIYEGIGDHLVNVRPLTVSLSDDNSTWYTVHTEQNSPYENGVVRIKLDVPLTAQYLKIEATGETILALDEVELYGLSDKP